MDAHQRCHKRGSCFLFSPCLLQCHTRVLCTRLLWPICKHTHRTVFSQSTLQSPSMQHSIIRFVVSVSHVNLRGEKTPVQRSGDAVRTLESCTFSFLVFLRQVHGVLLRLLYVQILRACRSIVSAMSHAFPSFCIRLHLSHTERQLSSHCSCFVRRVLWCVPLCHVLVKKLCSLLHVSSSLRASPVPGL